MDFASSAGPGSRREFAFRQANHLNHSDISILYLGVNGGTSLDRANALKRVGYAVTHVDLRDLMPKSRWMYRITWRIGGHVLSPWILRALPKVLKQARFDLCFVDSGEWVPPSVMRALRGYAGKIANYNIDDPLGERDVARSTAYRRSIPLYDLCVVVREENVAEAKAFGARDVLRVFRSADEVSHQPRPLDDADRAAWASEVLFLGTWFPERGPFLLQLAKLGVPLSIRGANWDKAEEWPELQKYWRGGQLAGDDYAKAIQCARVNLGLLSKGNRDLHTTRSLEIPSLGGLLCAERTSEHTRMYLEGKEALFWRDAEECAAVCLDVLADEPRRKAIAAAGHARIMRNGHYNENVMKLAVERVLQPEQALAVSR